MSIKTIELFAGVGGFRIGLNNVKLVNNNVIENDNFDFVWANQWEPSTKSQPAYDCYCERFGNNESHSNKDINKVAINKIPSHDLLVGGFPCQDYSVARSRSGEKGIEGKKGVLWWGIHKIIKKKKTKYLLLENVDRLLKSPAKQRGKNFAIILYSLFKLGYNVEWRVINAAEYGFAQKRRRVFIWAYKKGSKINCNLEDILFNTGIFAKCFPISNEIFKNRVNSLDLNNYKDLVDVSDNFEEAFYSTGVMIRGKIQTIQSIPIYEKPISLNEILLEKVSDKNLYIHGDRIKKFKYLKGSKKINRIRPNGEPYIYSEGKMQFPEGLNIPARTMLTSEGTTNRSTHVVRDKKNNKLRLLHPIEAERLNCFPDNWTESLTNRQRLFMMGNALVSGVVYRLKDEIIKFINK